jgi:hypothetical protein
LGSGDGQLSHSRRDNQEWGVEECSVLPRGLLLVVDDNGVICTATIASNLSADFFILLRHILLQHWGEPMEVVENIDLNFGQLT